MNGKGSQIRPKNIPNKDWESSFSTIFGTEYCFNCRKVQNVLKEKRGDRLFIMCQQCFMLIRNENIGNKKNEQK